MYPGRKPKKGTKEWLIAAEMKYGGYVENVPRLKVSSHDPRNEAEIKSYGMIGGDRMSPAHHNYAPKYAAYLRSFLQKQHRIVLAEIGILKGTGLAIWSDLFPDGRILGFDIDLSYIEYNMGNLRAAEAFGRCSPELYNLDQLAHNRDLVRDTLKGDTIDILIDDGHHSDQAILNTVRDFLPFLSKDFVCFIEDNEFCFKQLSSDYPQLIVRNFGELTIITRRDSIRCRIIWIGYLWRMRAQRYIKTMMRNSRTCRILFRPVLEKFLRLF